MQQPYLIAYITAGIALRPLIGNLLAGTAEIQRIGELGLLFLMFFLGMEMHVPNKRSLLLKPVIAQMIKTVLSVVFALLAGWLLQLNINYIVVLSMLFVFNSTAIVGDYLQKNNQLTTAFGIIVLNMLLLQDVLLAPALTVLRFLSTGEISIVRLTGAVFACVGIYLLLKVVRNGQMIKLPFAHFFDNDHDLQVFFGLFICLGFGLLAESVGLTSAIGSFLAGMLIGRIKDLHWLEHSLRPFRIFFVAFFFMSIGLQLEVRYIAEHPALVFIATLLVLLSNSLLSAIVFRLLHFNWKESFYAGALLAHTGEFGILACSLAHSMGLIDTPFFKAAIAITGLTFLLSTTWIKVLQHFARFQKAL